MYERQSRHKRHPSFNRKTSFKAIKINDLSKLPRKSTIYPRGTPSTIHKTDKVSAKIIKHPLVLNQMNLTNHIHRHQNI
jgi:hypothetical protein